MREDLYCQKLWNTYMRKRMEKEMRNSAQIDEAFKNIKTATQVTDVQEMVSKFMTRETTYSQLLKTVSESESKIDHLKKSNEELRAQLHELTLDSSNNQDKSAQPQVDNDSDIIQLNNELQSCLKEHARLQDRFKGINIVNDQICNWAKRIHKKFSTLTNDDTFQKSPNDLVAVFSAMNEVVEKELTTIAENYNEDDGGIEYDQVFKDIANEDFVNKNIRVRPVSGMVDETRDGRQSNVSRGLDGEKEDGEERFNQDAMLEIDNDRKNIKAILKKKLDEAERKAAALEAAKKKKSD